ncbi:MAG: hypothetical protein J6X79_00865 [Bacteroidales bacterium]|nr:hypothetical protein [Bacteroidales bacterium]
MGKTMQQQDHDAWELGYGNQYNTGDHNNLELEAMREALRRREAEEAAKKVEEESKITNNEEQEEQ